MNLTERELELIQLLADDYTNRQIAAKLLISTTAVIDDIARLYRKLGATDRAGAIAAAARLATAKSEVRP
jgi:DNA-binding CsgD family transcriptional regulator